MMARKSARRKKTPTLPEQPTGWDMGAAGQANRHRLVAEGATDFDPDTGRETPNPNGVRRYRRQSWIREYGKKHLDPHHVAAAEKLRMASEGMMERDPLARLGEVSARGGDPQGARIDARRYFRQLWDTIPTDFRATVERVALDDLPIRHGNTATRERQIQQLRRGLDAIS